MIHKFHSQLRIFGYRKPNKVVEPRPMGIIRNVDDFFVPVSATGSTEERPSINDVSIEGGYPNSDQRRGHCLDLALTRRGRESRIQKIYVTSFMDGP